MIQLETSTSDEKKDILISFPEGQRKEKENVLSDKNIQKVETQGIEAKEP